MSSHIDEKVNDEFEQWLNKNYGTHGAVKTTRGKIHDYLGMTFDFTNEGKVIIDMKEYVQAMLDDFSVKFQKNEKAITPASENLFQEVKDDILSKEMAEEYHTFVAKALFLCKRARPDLHTTVAVLCTRVRQPTKTDWNQLVRLLKYCNGTIGDVLTLEANDLHTITWFVDSAFAVHPDYKSHTGAIMTFGRGAIQSISRKQKLNTRSSTEAELVAADDVAIMILWTRFFLEKQGLKIKENILMQDNKSTILLLKNGKRSSSKRTRALNIRYFYLTDQIEKGLVSVHYCAASSMIADYMSKPLQGRLFHGFRSKIMGI
jgi:hypothetical protein